VKKKQQLINNTYTYESNSMEIILYEKHNINSIKNVIKVRIVHVCFKALSIALNADVVQYFVYWYKKRWYFNQSSSYDNYIWL